RVTDVPDPAPGGVVAPVGAAAPAAGAVGAVVDDRLAASTSSRAITPPSPDPTTAVRSTPRSLASLRTGGFASTGPLAIPGSVSARPGTGSGAPRGSPPVGANDSATSTRRDTGASGENAEATRSCTSDPAPATSADTAALRGRRFAS